MRTKPRFSTFSSLILLVALTACHGRVTSPELDSQPVFTAPVRADADRPYGAWNRITEGSVGEDRFPAPFPDGRGLVFSSSRHSHSHKLYYRQDDGGRVLRQISHGPGDDIYPAVAPDAERIVFASNRSGDWRLYLASGLEDRSPRRLSDEEVTEIHPSWSSDGRSVVYARLSPVSGEWEIWIREIDGPARRITAGLFPELHPHADRVVFQRPRRRGEMWYSIWTVELDGTRETEIVSGRNYGATNPSWSPDGDWIVYGTVSPSTEDPAATDRRPRGNDLYVIRADGLHERRLTFQDTPEWNPIWSRDGWIYFCAKQSGETAVWRVRP